MKKDGTPDAYSSVCSLSQMGVLKKRVEDILYEMAKRMKEGDIACVPVDNADYKPCEWCEFKSVCLHTEEDPVFALKPIDEKTWLREEEPYA